jgi:hypothetical protein
MYARIAIKTVLVTAAIAGIAVKLYNDALTRKLDATLASMEVARAERERSWQEFIESRKAHQDDISRRVSPSIELFQQALRDE